MPFNSFAFAIFLSIVFILYWFLFSKNFKSQNLLILLASYFFYGWWSKKFLLLLVLSTVLDYFYGFGVDSINKKKSKLFLWLSIINNLGILGIFKYYDFFALEFQAGFKLVGIRIDPILLQVALPIGISFYTFHGMSYVFDIYRSLRKPVTNFVDYAVFVCFFPLLVAGPIERSNHLLPQVQSTRYFNYNQSAEGCRLILWGLFKKVVIADSLSVIVESCFKEYPNQDSYTLIIAAISFSIQIYCDFSGYSDIAIGTAKLFGFELLSNFKYPYFSRDIAEFWRRWHISLTSWFRDYLYIPLGGSKEGKFKTVRNIFIVFLVSGFWHGANWNFIVWGVIHACGFLALFLLNRNRKHVSSVVAANSKLPSIKELFQMILTFVFVTFAWIFFRAHSVRSGFSFVKRIIINGWQNPNQFLHPERYLIYPIEKSAIFYIIPFIAIDWCFRRDERSLIILKKFKNLRVSVYIFIIILILYFSVKQSHQQFIYFQF